MSCPSCIPDADPVLQGRFRARSGHRGQVPRRHHVEVVFSVDASAIRPIKNNFLVTRFLLKTIECGNSLGSRCLVIGS
jgi:hypothetical protein